MSLLKILEDKKEAIHFAEFAALLHDLDKLRMEFLGNPDIHTFASKMIDSEALDKATGRGKKQKAYKCPSDTGPIERSRLWSGYSFPDAMPMCLPISKTLLVSPLPSATLTEDLSIDLDSAFIYHHDSVGDKPFPFMAYLVNGGLGGCDGIDSALDKNAKDKQVGGIYRIDSPFGHVAQACELDNKDGMPTPYQDAYVFVAKWLKQKTTSAQVYSFLIDENGLQKYLKKGLGETRYPCNDVTLWAHSYSVASMTKALLCKILIEYAQTQNSYQLPGRGELIEWSDTSEVKLRACPNRTDFAYCKVTLDRGYLWSRALRAQDVMGMADQVDTLLDEIRTHFETKILAGNQVYRDQEHIMFVIPRLATWFDERGQQVLPESLQEDFEKEINGELTQFIEKRLIEMDCHELPYAIDFGSELLIPQVEKVEERMLNRSETLLKRSNAGKQSTDLLLKLQGQERSGGARCGVCGIRPAGNNEDSLCHPCTVRRNSRTVRELRTAETGMTSNLDKLLQRRGEENRLALVRISFDLNPLYESTIFKKVVWQNQQKRKHPSPGRLHRAWETLTRFLFECRSLAIETSDLIFPVTIHPTPDRMEFVVPAAQLMDIAGKIYDKYEVEFGKFRDVLPMSIGCVVFYKKFPLYVVMDALRNMAGSFETLTPEDWGVTSNTPADGTSTLQLRPPQFRGQGNLAGWAKWYVSEMRSDGAQDKFHPHFSLRQNNGQYKLKRVWEIQSNDTIRVTEGRFDFILADSAQTRFAFGEGGRQHHVLGTRPAYPLSSIREFQRIWDLFNKARLTSSQLSAIEGALVDKMISWPKWLSENPEDKKTVLNFCESVLLSPNALGARDKRTGRYKDHLDANSNLPEERPDYENSDKALLIHAARNGVLLDVIDLYRHIQKTPLRSEGTNAQNVQPPPDNQPEPEKELVTT